MKQKKTAYYLIPVAIIVWGYIIWQIVGAMSGEEEAFIDLPTQEILKDTTEYIAPPVFFHCTDPFLERSILDNVPTRQDMSSSNNISSSNHRGSSNSRREERKQRAKRINWNFLEYNGTISSKEGRIALLKINNKNVILETEEEEDGVKVLQIHEDSVRVIYEEVEQTIIKK